MQVETGKAVTCLQTYVTLKTQVLNNAILSHLPRMKDLPSQLQLWLSHMSFLTASVLPAPLNMRSNTFFWLLRLTW